MNKDRSVARSKNLSNRPAAGSFKRHGRRLGLRPSQSTAGVSRKLPRGLLGGLSAIFVWKGWATFPSIAAVAALWWTAQSAVVTQQQLVLAQTTQQNERYEKAVAKLGSENGAMRVAGVHELADLRRGSIVLKDKVADLLTALIYQRLSSITSCQHVAGAQDFMLAVSEVVGTSGATCSSRADDNDIFHNLPEGHFLKFTYGWTDARIYLTGSLTHKWLFRIPGGCSPTSYAQAAASEIPINNVRVSENRYFRITEVGRNNLTGATREVWALSSSLPKEPPLDLYHHEVESLFPDLPAAYSHLAGRRSINSCVNIVTNTVTNTVDTVLSTDPATETVDSVPR